MKISDFPNRKLEGPGLEKEIKGFGQVRKPESFMEQLNRAQDGHLQQQLENLLKDIEKQGVRLANNMTVRELKLYKDLVKKFIKEAVGKTYRLKEEAGWDRRGRYKMYTLIQNVDTHLDELTKLVLEEQSDQLSVLGKLDEIRGILMDIYS
ncbi:MAG: YaaR family protein [Clostridia bacterium]|nr:YaaR family protein [Clostridia bacterium]